MEKQIHIGKLIKAELDRFRKRDKVDASELMLKFNISRNKFYNVMKQEIPSEHDTALFGIILDFNFIPFLPIDRQEEAYQEKKIILKKYTKELPSILSLNEDPAEYGNQNNNALEKMQSEMTALHDNLKKLEEENDSLKNQLIETQKELLDIIKRGKQ